MAKTMARLEAGTVINIEWCSDNAAETEALKNIGDYPAGIGDTYSEGKWYRDGEALLTPLEEAQQENAALQAKLEELNEAYTQGVNSL